MSEQPKLSIRQILNEISELSEQTQELVLSTLPDQEYVQKELSIIKDSILYEQLLAKPLMTGNDILRFPSQPNDYLIEKFLWRGSTAFFVGAEKACKSIFMTQQAMALTYGGSFLNCFDVSKPMNVLYVQAEGDMGETKERVLSTTSEGGCHWNPNNWRHYYPSALALDTDLDKNNNPIQGGYSDFVNRIIKDQFSPDVIIIDPLYMAMEGDLNDNKAARQFCRNIRRLKEKFGCAVIIVHHEHRPKTDRFSKKIEEGDNSIFGSSMWKNFASHVIRISLVNSAGNPITAEKDGESKVKYRKIACHTQRNDNVVKKLVLELNQNPLMFKDVSSNVGSASEESVLTCIKNNQPIASCQVAELTGINSQTVHRCFSKLYKEKGKIKIHSHKGNKILYCTTDYQGELYEQDQPKRNED